MIAGVAGRSSGRESALIEAGEPGTHPSSQAAHAIFPFAFLI
jgi:hypothetical protein